MVAAKTRRAWPHDRLVPESRRALSSGSRQVFRAGSGASKHTLASCTLMHVLRQNDCVKKVCTGHRLLLATARRGSNRGAARGRPTTASANRSWSDRLMFAAVGSGMRKRSGLRQHGHVIRPLCNPNLLRVQWTVLYMSSGSARQAGLNGRRRSESGSWTTPPSRVSEGPRSA